MTHARPTRLAATLILLLAEAAPSYAQTFEIVGTRAQGMGGAFVAVADDASAVYWNPAGLATGATFDFQMAIGRSAAAGSVASRSSTALVALALPALGLGYYRLRTTLATPSPSPTVLISGDRQQGGSGGVRVQAISTGNFGVSLVQSVTNTLVIGTTLRLVRGRMAAGLVAGEALDEALEAADRLPTQAETTFDLDAGVMASLGRVRVGLVGRNLREPVFRSANAVDYARFDRQVRVGVALLGPVVVSADLDLTQSAGPFRDRRDFAAGVEGWVADRRIGARAGFRANTLTEARPVVSGGLSLAVRESMLIEGQMTKGGRESDKSWGVTGRVTF